MTINEMTFDEWWIANGRSLVEELMPEIEHIAQTAWQAEAFDPHEGPTIKKVLADNKRLRKLLEEVIALKRQIGKTCFVDLVDDCVERMSKVVEEAL